MQQKNNLNSGIRTEVQDVYPADSEIGKRLRRDDAAQMMKQMLSAESQVHQREQIARNCSDRIEQMNEAHRLNMDYLLQFGVWATHRQQLLQILEDVEQHGHKTLREAVELANANVKTNQQLDGLSQSSNGLSPAESSVS